MKINIDIKDDSRTKVADLLNTLLADEFVLYTKTRNAHWNITGPHFSHLHLFFEAQYKELEEIVDEVAERVRAIGHFSLGSLKDFLEVTRLSEDEHNFSDSRKIIQTLVADHESIICSIRKEISLMQDKYKDAGSADFVTGLLKQHETMAWMLRSHVL